MHDDEVIKLPAEVEKCRKIPLLPVSSSMASYRFRLAASFSSNINLPHRTYKPF